MGYQFLFRNDNMKKFLLSAVLACVATSSFAEVNQDQKESLCRSFADTAVYLHKANQNGIPKEKITAEMNNARANLDDVFSNKNDFTYQFGVKFIERSFVVLDEAYNQKVLPKNKQSLYLANVDSKTYRQCIKSDIFS